MKSHYDEKADDHVVEYKMRRESSPGITFSARAAPLFGPQRGLIPFQHPPPSPEPPQPQPLTPPNAPETNRLSFTRQ